VTTYGKYKNDVRRLLGEAKGNSLVTTMIDYYGLPADFPGMGTRPVGSPQDRVTHIENSIFEDCGSPKNLRPFLALHEFEAWLFASREELSRTMTQPDKRAAIAAIRDAFETPEDINEGPATAPSKRIKQVFPEYKKTLHGPLAAGRIGIAAIRAECAHFDRWVRELEVFATS